MDVNGIATLNGAQVPIVITLPDEILIPGPQGEPGVAGPAGPTGPQGPQGPAGAGGAAVRYVTEAMENSGWVLLGSPVQVYRAGLVAKLAVPLQAGQLAEVVAEAEGSIYKYPWGTGMFPFSMFQTAAILAFSPGVTPPNIVPLSEFPGANAVVVCKGIGQDIGQSFNYYYPFVRVGSFVAPEAGTYSFALYTWGGSTEGGSGNAALLYPGTLKMSVIAR